jgi:ATP-dependent Lhr-like helicase
MSSASRSPRSSRSTAGPADPGPDSGGLDLADTDFAERWFAERGWAPFEFQREVWAAMAAGESGLLHATTGAGKTYAVWFGALARALALGADPQARQAPPLGVLWLTPMRALAADTTRALTLPLTALAPAWTVGLRTGDTPSAERARQDRRWPSALVTTPESLSLMLTRERAREELAGVHTVVVDEWHELIGSKRGVQVQLALARLAQCCPQLAVWGVSATLGNLDEAMATLVGPQRRGRLVRGRVPKALQIDALLPTDAGRFSWGGHLGAQMRDPVVAEIDSAATSLVFTNTRSQAEIWYQLLLEARPDWAGLIALHHGSLDPSVRAWVEAGLKAGQLKAVVATSSLDLGVDFLPVERVLQIGSAKGIARLLQRAGRSGHAPGRPSRITLVPTNTMELVEAAAAREAALAGRVEARRSPHEPLDVLVQHLVTVALGGGFRPDALYAEVRAAHAYRELPREHFDWALAFVEHGGSSLGAYPEYHRVLPDESGTYRVPDRGIARRHRLQVGTIVSDASLAVKWLSGGTLGHIEEGFIARLKPGDGFFFAGRALEYIRTRDMAAYVRPASRRRGAIPVWGGGKMPLSSELAEAMQDLLFAVGRQGAAGEGEPVPERLDTPELRAAAPMLATQRRVSHLPAPGVLLIEHFRSREGQHLMLYPFAGRNVHIGLAHLLAWRLAQGAPNTFSLSVNDYGLELLSAESVDLARLQSGRVLAADRLLEDVLASLNAGELAQRRFREIARVAGLIFSGYPGAPKSTRQLQASSSLFYEVFRKYDAGNRLLTQADQEVLAQELDVAQLGATLQRLAGLRIDWVELRAPSPFSLPLMVERLREQFSTEKLADRLARLLRDAESQADAAADAGSADLPAAPRRRRSRQKP